MNCPICKSSNLSEYHVNFLTEQICWNCGHYESDSKAYREHPELFENMVRENPYYFLHKYFKFQLSDEFLQHHKSDEDLTEPRYINEYP